MRVYNTHTHVLRVWERRIARRGEEGGEGDLSNSAIYPLNSAPPASSLRLLDFAVRICGMSEAGTSPSGFLIAKRIRPGRGAKP